MNYMHLLVGHSTQKSKKLEVCYTLGDTTYIRPNRLKEDAKVRWHRDEYKKLLKRFDEYYNKLEKKIADKEQQIAELTKLLEVLN